MPDANVLHRGDAGYEAARRDCVWNGRIADRFPELIVQAVTEDDIVAALRTAREHDMKVGMRSGGHSWSGSHLRDGGMLLERRTKKGRVFFSCSKYPSCKFATWDLQKLD